jgi:hypothetical protein
MVVIVGMAAVALILVLAVAFHFANGARSGKSGVLARAYAASMPHTKGEDRVSELD